MEKNKLPIGTLHDLMDYDSVGLIISEARLATHVAKWIGKTNSLPLKNVLEKYLVFIQQHVRKGEMHFDTQLTDSFSNANPVMNVLIEEIENTINRCSAPELKDACLLAGVQAINHLKISLYGTCAAYANSLEMKNEAAVFHEAEVNEKQIDDRLSQLAEFDVNKKARVSIVLPETN